MNKRQVLKVLTDLRNLGNETETEALDMAMAAVRKSQDHKKLGALGGTATHKKYGKRKMAAWGKMGGRPPAGKRRKE